MEDQKVEWVNAFEVVVGRKTKSAPNHNIPAERQQASETTLNAIRTISFILRDHKMEKHLPWWKAGCFGCLQ